ncbi:Acetyltransferase domain containing protein [Salinisphaera shabanensis E1L3A]|uniref:Acetyltransferase domain containing protein n=1 Tax=Salinisphaera shabanensis E1L3A TaxID=1033802 RepID=U2E964_9GAMM|nr:GNAT family N-acetyltransferase [Salinisphaera shabanensis]ERJ20241.1 Acetyltransferase domain containing protein [Salinisphaera shabanensis E1L3A]
MTQLTTTRCSGSEIQPYVDELAALRIRVFRDFPYLYDGDIDYERDYLATYVNSSRSLAFLVHDSGQLVGATTALPLQDEEPAFRKPLADAGFDVARVFYFGESLLLSNYRGHGLGHRFFDEREAWAKQAGDFSHACFCAVQRPEEHPLRPAGYQPLDAFWQRRGFARRDDINAFYRWRDIDQREETDKRLTFWIRALH